MSTQNTHKQVLLKFLLLCLLMVGYFGYLSYEYDFVTGGVASLLTWSFFVLCTPVADAGFLLDFPLRVLFGIRMVVSEMAVWTIAILLNLVSFSFFPQYYDTTIVTRLLQKIIATPNPYWFIVILAGIGTFLSIRFGDELMDVVHHHDRHFFHKNHFKHELVLIIFFVAVLFGYYDLIASLGLDQQL